MHLRELLYEPINFFVCTVFILLVSFIMLSVVLDNSGLPNPISYMGSQLGLLILEHARK